MITSDGTEHAAAAIAPVSATMPGAIVVTVWKPSRDVILAASLGPASLISDSVEAEPLTVKATGRDLGGGREGRRGSRCPSDRVRDA